MTGNLNRQKDYHVDVLTRMNRLGVMRKLAMLDADEEPFFDRLTHLASEVIGVPVSLVSMVSANYQFFKSSVCKPETWNSERRTPLSHSFCQHVVTTGKPLIVEDAREVDFLKDNLAIPDLDVISYLGMPLRTEDGENLGSFCVIDSQPHKWTDDEIAIIEAFSRVVNAEIDARGDAYNEKRLEDYVANVSRPRLDDLEADLKSAQTTQAIVERMDTLAAAIRD
ncbi:MAG: GAF domain-containing protein [Chloroflexota bacterium]